MANLSLQSPGLARSFGEIDSWDRYALAREGQRGGVASPSNVSFRFIPCCDRHLL